MQTVLSASKVIMWVAGGGGTSDSGLSGHMITSGHRSRLRPGLRDATLKVESVCHARPERAKRNQELQGSQSE